MEIGLAVGGAFLSSALNVLFDRLAPNGDLFNMFKMDKHDVRLLKKLRMTLLGLQAVLSDAENKQASNPYVSQWLNELQDAVDGAENLIEEVNYEVLRLKVESQHQNLGETRNQQHKAPIATVKRRNHLWIGMNLILDDSKKCYKVKLICPDGVVLDFACQRLEAVRKGKAPEE